MRTEDQANNITDEKLETNTNPETQPVEKKSSKKDSAFKRTLRQIGFALLFLLIGALAVSLALYLPTNSKLRKASLELERLTPMEAEYLELVETSETLSTQAAVYKILSNASMMRIALIDESTNRINLYIRYIEEDLSNLEITSYPDIPASLSGQFKNVTDRVSSNQAKALDELQTFQNDLLLLIDNLE